MTFWFGVPTAQTFKTFSILFEADERVSHRERRLQESMLSAAKDQFRNLNLSPSPVHSCPPSWLRHFCLSCVCSSARTSTSTFEKFLHRKRNRVLWRRGLQKSGITEIKWGVNSWQLYTLIEWWHPCQLLIATSTDIIHDGGRGRRLVVLIKLINFHFIYIYIKVIRKSSTWSRFWTIFTNKDIMQSVEK